MVNEGVEDRPICRKNERIGLIKNDLCHSVKAGGDFDKKDIDDGYQIWSIPIMPMKSQS